MSTIKSSAENLTLNADGANNDIIFQSNGSTKATLDQAGLLTATSFAGSGANLTGVGVDGIVSNANATAMTITSAERVGINKTSPDGKLEVLGGGETALVVKTANSGEYAAIIQSVTTNRTPILEVRNNGGGSAFRVQGNDETVIGDSGWGTLPQNAEETLLVTRNGAVISTIYAGENSSARDAILQIQTKNTAAQQRIRFLNGHHAQGTGSGQIHYNPDGHFMAFDANASERFRITANGVTFNGDTAAANALDDYEEGTWTIVLTGSTSGSGNLTTGYYTKIGRMVHCTFTISNTTFPTFAGNMRLSLPFTGASNMDNRQENSGDVYFYPLSKWTSGSSFTGVSFQIQGSSPTFGFFQIKRLASDRQAQLGSSQGSNSGAGGMYARFSITYTAA